MLMEEMILELGKAQRLGEKLQDNQKIFALLKGGHNQKIQKLFLELFRGLHYKAVETELTCAEISDRVTGSRDRWGDFSAAKRIVFYKKGFGSRHIGGYYSTSYTHEWNNFSITFALCTTGKDLIRKEMERLGRKRFIPIFDIFCDFFATFNSDHSIQRSFPINKKVTSCFDLNAPRGYICVPGFKCVFKEINLSNGVLSLVTNKKHKNSWNGTLLPIESGRLNPINFQSYALIQPLFDDIETVVDLQTKELNVVNNILVKQINELEKKLATYLVLKNL